jgi:hypothetical protein
MALKKFFDERSERIELIKNLKEALISGSSDSIQNIEVGNQSEYLSFFLSLGNMAYKSGDADYFEYFLKAMYQVIQAKPRGINLVSLKRRLRDYAFRSIRAFDLAMFDAVVEVVVDNICSIENAAQIDDSLDFLHAMSVRATEWDFEEGVYAIVDKFGLLEGHFIDQELAVSLMSLRNYIVVLVHYLGSVNKSNLQKRVISNVSDFMGSSLPPNDNLVNNIETESLPSV